MQVFYASVNNPMNNNLQVGALTISFKTNFISGYDSSVGADFYFTIRAAIAEGHIIASWYELDVWYTEAMELLQSVAAASGDLVWDEGICFFYA